MSAREFRDRLRRRAKRAGIDMPAAVVDRLERYYLLLTKWNAKINLTSFGLGPEGEDEALDRLLIEPIVAARHIPGDVKSMLDVGSGGGSPAIPLKIVAPHVHLRMVEAKTRKAVFLREALRELEITDAAVETSRFEELLTRPELHEGVDLITIRAVRVEPRTLMNLQAFLRPGGYIFLFRGAGGADITGSVAPPLGWLATYPLADSGRSRLVVLRKNLIGRSR